MSAKDNEEELLRSVALQNARAILLARERAEKALLETKSELERKNKELLEQREQFRVTLFSIGDGVITTDTKGILTFLNPVAESLIGWKLREAVGLHIDKVFVILNEKTRKPVESPISAALNDGTVVSLANHTILVRKDGLQIPIEDSAAPIRDTEGKITGAVMVFHDVTERRRKDQELTRSEQFGRSIIDSTRDCIKVLDLSGNLLSISKNGQRMLGISDATPFLNKPWTDFWSGQDKDAAIAAIRAAHEGKDGTFVGFFTTPEGTPKWWDVHVTPVVDAEGKPERLLAISRDITARRQDVEQMRQLAAAIESSDDAILTMTLEAIVTSWNRGAEQLYGYTPGEIIGKSVTILIPKDRKDEEPEILERLKRGERIEHYETIRRTKAGDDRHVSLTVSPVMDSSGKIVGVSKISRDITQQKRDEEAIRRSEEDLRSLASSIHQLAWMATPDGHIFWYNQRWYEYTGTTFEQMEGWGWQSVHDPAFLPQVIERWQTSISKGDPFSMEFPMRGADGQFRWFLTRVNPLCDSEGHVLRWFGTNTDVDEVRKAQEALREESTILELLNDTGTAIASSLDLQTLVQTVTDAGTKLSGAKFGAFFYNVINASEESYLLYTLSGAPREAFEKFGMPRNTPVFSTTFSGTAVVRSPDITKDPRYGTMKPHYGMPAGHLPVRSYLAVPVTSRSGNVIGGLFFGHPEPNVFTERSEKLIVGIAAQAAIAIDNARLYDAAQKEVANRKRAEEALHAAQHELSRYAEDLEKKVGQRTSALREKIEELESFSYSVSHDLRAPVRAIQSFALILKEDRGLQASALEKEYLPRIASAAERMDRLIKDVLTYSRISQTAMLPEPIDSGKLIRGIMDSYPALQSDSAAIELDGPFPIVLGVEAVLMQCVSNILSNAVKFVAPGVKPKVRVWSENDHANGRVRLFFKDNGLGIPAKAHEKIFGIFERVSDDYEGTGIGLSIVKKGIERMGGTVGLESELGKGSTFWLELNRPATDKT
jgi:PAS domain S-box-containing protein